MSEENPAHNKFLLSSPYIVSTAISGLLDGGKPLGILLNMRLAHTSLPKGHCEPIIIYVDMAKDLHKEIRNYLSSGRHPDHRPAALGLVPGITVPPDHPLLAFTTNFPQAVMDDAITDHEKQCMKFCHLHDFHEAFVLEFVSIDGTTRPFCVASTVMHAIADQIGAALQALSQRR